MLVMAAVLDILRKHSQDSEEMETQTHGASWPTSVGLLPSIHFSFPGGAPPPFSAPKALGSAFSLA